MTPDDSQQTPGKALVRYLKKHRITRQVFAVSLGVSVDSVHRWCRDEQAPSPDNSELIYTRTGGAVDFRRPGDTAAA